jgi:hypothetical protein
MGNHRSNGLAVPKRAQDARPETIPISATSAAGAVRREDAFFAFAEKSHPLTGGYDFCADAAGAAAPGRPPKDGAF